ncbi:hypothetical protein D3C86_2126020 [compost metagenome]
MASSSAAAPSTIISWIVAAWTRTSGRVRVTIPPSSAMMPAKYFMWRISLRAMLMISAPTPMSPMA